MSLEYLLQPLKREKNKVKKKERERESCDLQLATSKEKGKESRQVVWKASWRHNETVFEFVYLAIFWIYIDSHKEERESERVSTFYNYIKFNCHYWQVYSNIIKMKIYLLFIIWI